MALSCNRSLLLLYAGALVFCAIQSKTDESLTPFTDGFRQYNPGLARLYEQQSSGSDTLLDALFNASTMSLTEKRSILEFIYNNVIGNNPYKDIEARVRSFSRFSFCDQEIAFIEKRGEKSLNNLQLLTGRFVTSQEFPKIGVCLSGGGVRAAIGAAGMLHGLEKAGILGSALWVASLSGSTWAVAPWISENKSCGDFIDGYLLRVSDGIIGKDLSNQLYDSASFIALITDVLLRRLAFDDKPNVIDMYGLLLGLSYFDETNKNALMSLDLASQGRFLTEGDYPLPIYSAAILRQDKRKNYNYAWLEFSPYEVASYDLKTAVPTWSFGRRFDRGISKSVSPSLPLHYLMGIWGSAISASFYEMFKFMLGKLQPHSLFDPLKLLLDETVIGDIRIFPAKIRNMNYHIPDFPETTTRVHTVVDAGISVNIPVAPLLQRGADIIIIGDFSADVATSNELRKAEMYAMSHNLPFPQIDYTGIASRPCSIFSDPTGAAPTVVYLPMAKNSHFNENYDPQILLGVGEPLNTTNFVYTQQQAEDLAGLMRFNVLESRDGIIDSINQMIDKKMNMRR